MPFLKPQKPAYDQLKQFVPSINKTKRSTKFYKVVKLLKEGGKSTNRRQSKAK
jgi:hypothetical protein